MQQQLAAAARNAHQEMVQWRRYLHENPEITWQEYETTEWIARWLDQWNVPYIRPAATGLVGIITGNRPGPTVAVRADIDALPIHEENTFSFASKRPGAMHACGHDGHTASLLGLTRFLSQNRDFPGTVKLLFQPAEEGGAGALKFVEAGVLDDVSACIGVHLMSTLPTGQVSITEGPAMAASDGFTARIQGKGGHAASPHQAVDPIVVACAAVMNLQTIVSRRVDPIKSAVITIGSIHAGQAANVIPDSVEIKASIRSFDPEVRQQLHDEVIRTLEGTCAVYGATVQVEYRFGYPCVNNDPAITDVLREASAEVVGEANVLKAAPIMGSEDFAYYSQKCPSSFLFVGAMNPEEGANWPHHHPRFTVDEAALPHSMEILGRAALKLLGK